VGSIAVLRGGSDVLAVAMLLRVEVAQKRFEGLSQPQAVRTQAGCAGVQCTTAPVRRLQLPAMARA
jgi:hypothetical protein